MACQGEEEHPQIVKTRLLHKIIPFNHLGFRLANPCYEQARSRGNKPPWNVAGQENAFGSSHALLLATTSYNATAWLSQLKSVADVTAVDAPLKVTC